MHWFKPVKVSLSLAIDFHMSVNKKEKNGMPNYGPISDFLTSQRSLILITHPEYLLIFTKWKDEDRLEQTLLRIHL